jgi:predicted dehydrogenase
MSAVRIGLVGAGWMGSEHGRNILKNPAATLAGICDSSRESIRKFKASTAAACPEYSDYRDLLASSIDAVVIASPNAMHAEMAVAAARAGKHIFCEKPMAITLDDCRRVRDAVSQAGVNYLIGYHRRLNPLYQHVKQLINDGSLGTPFLVESDYIHHIPGDWDIWSWLGKESIAGSLFHAGSGHNVDLIRYLCGEVVEVSCMKGAFLPRKQQVETEDTAMALYRFASGAIGKVHCCVGPICPFQFNLRLYGTRGTVLNNRVWLDSIPRFADPDHAEDCLTLPASWIPDNVQGGISETWGRLIDHFVRMLTDHEPCINDVHSALKTSAACFAAMESARTGRAIDLKDMGP